MVGDIRGNKSVAYGFNIKANAPFFTCIFHDQTKNNYFLNLPGDFMRRFCRNSSLCMRSSDYSHCNFLALGKGLCTVYDDGCLSYAIHELYYTCADVESYFTILEARKNVFLGVIASSAKLKVLTHCIIFGGRCKYFVAGSAMHFFQTFTINLCGIYIEKIGQISRFSNCSLNDCLFQTFRKKRETLKEERDYLVSNPFTLLN